MAEPVPNYGSIEDMGSPHEEKNKKCTSSLILTVVGLCILALVLGTLLSFFITKSIYDYQEEPSDETHGRNPAPPIENLLLPTSVIPNSYELSIKAYIPGYKASIPDSKNLTFEGQVIIDVEVLKEVRKITLNARNLTNVTAYCTANGTTVKVERISHFPELEKIYFELKDAIKPGQKVLLTVHYTGEINSDLGGMYQTRYTSADGRERIAAVTQMQPMNARKLVPCFDEPVYKANWTVTVMHPKGTKAISNGIENGSSTEVDDDFLASHFETTPKMSSYLLAIFISEFDYIEGKTHSGIRFRIWSRPEAKNQTKFALESGIKCLQFYEEYYGIPFPLKKQDMVALPDFDAGAMENWGMITYRENALLYDEKLYKPAEKLRVTTVIAHELAHQWFGNLVTMKWWNDLWLNEGFATLIEFMGADEISNGNFRMKDYFMVDAMADAFRKDQMASGHPLTHKINNKDEIDESFDEITYQKGASVLNMIGYTMGKENFRTGLRTYLKNHQYSNSTSADLMQALDAAVTDVEGPHGGKLNVTAFARKWTDQMGFPYLYLDEVNGTHLQITQKRYKLDPQATEKPKFANPEYGFKWDVPVWLQFGKGAAEMKWLPANGQLIIPKADGPIIMNAEGYAFVRSNYRKEYWQEIFNQLKKDHSMFSQRTRFMLISDAFAMAEIGELSYEQLFNLFDYMPKENEYMPWRALRTHFKTLLNYFGNEPVSKIGEMYYTKLLEAPFNKTNIQHISENYLNDEKFFENIHEAGIYLTYCDYNRASCKKELRDLYENKVLSNCKEKTAIASECNTVVAPLRAVVYCRAVEDGDETDFEKIMELYKNEPVQVEKVKLQDALACSKDTRTLKTLLSLAVDRSTNLFRFQDVSALFDSVANNRNGKEIVLNFLLEHWEEILNSFSEQHEVITRIISNSANGIQTRLQVEQLKNFRRTAKDAMRYEAFFEQTMAAEQRLMWLEKNSKTLEKLFKKRL